MYIIYMYMSNDFHLVKNLVLIFFFYNEFKIYMLSYLDSSVMIPGDFKSLRQTYLES